MQHAILCDVVLWAVGRRRHGNPNNPMALLSARLLVSCSRSEVKLGDVPRGPGESRSPRVIRGHFLWMAKTWLSFVAAFPLRPGCSDVVWSSLSLPKTKLILHFWSRTAFGAFDVPMHEALRLSFFVPFV